ncbi:MAG: preprotein translocase subunit SecE [candidate division Zixibacteria bacterium]|nr:preprotein translocase subunit SecE [candidate division Zixibacteria bacterium]
MLGRVFGFFNETKQELNKVTWPSKNELFQATAVVIIATALMALYIGSADFVLSALMRLMLG